MKKVSLICGLAVVGLSLGISATAHAWAGELTTPGVAFVQSYPADARAKVMATLSRKGVTFLGGSFINSWTSLRYAGDTTSLNLFLDDLVKCPGVTVHVSLKALTDDSDWRVGHEADRNSFQVEVNLKSRRLDLEKLYIPEHKGPPLAK